MVYSVDKIPVAEALASHRSLAVLDKVGILQIVWICEGEDFIINSEVQHPTPLQPAVKVCLIWQQPELLDGLVVALLPPLRG